MLHITNKNRKKIYIGTGVLVISILAYLYKHNYKPNYTILGDEYDAYARYSNGYVYIGDEDYLNSLENISPNDVLVLDERNLRDSNMAIYNSYVISNKDERNEILEILCEYEKEYPSNWDRSIESMRLEWFCHNICCYMNYKTDHTSEVDLNNNDEDTFNNKVLSRILKL